MFRGHARRVQAGKSPLSFYSCREFTVSTQQRSQGASRRERERVRVEGGPPRYQPGAQANSSIISVAHRRLSAAGSLAKMDGP